MADLFISPCEAHSSLCRPDAPLIIDVRIDEDVDTHPVRLPLAVRSVFTDCEAICRERRATQVIIYCHKGGKLSQIAAALLRAQGVEAWVLRGGLVSWITECRPVLSATAAPEHWLAPLDPSWDEAVSMWLIARVITNSAVVLQIERDQIEPGLQLYNARSLPADPAALAAEFGLAGLDLERLRVGLHALLEGRLIHGANPLSLIDDLFAGEPA